MKENMLSLIVLLSPCLYLATAIFSWFQDGMRPAMLKKAVVLSTYVNVIIAVVCCVLVFNNGLLESPLLGISEIGFSIRLDSISVIMFTMIALLSFVIIKFSLNYLDGEERQGAFIGRLSATILCVQLLVLSGNIGLLMISWVLTSTSLHRLLVFYPDRPGAIAVARKKFLVARLADTCLFVACVLLYNEFHTGNLELIFSHFKNGVSMNDSNVEFIALFLTLAALIKSAQFPTHSWLTEVMETPTPVSALLHAGLLNAGPFLIIRMSYITDFSIYSSLLLISIGGFTALFASVVYLTQTSVKTALGYSSVAHMGFSLFVCGLGLYAAAMLHLVAHSFYKAHSFLASGSAIDLKRGLKSAPLTRLGNPIKMIAGMLSAAVVYTVFAFAWGINIKEQFTLFVVGAIIVLGLARIFSSAMDSPNSISLLLRATILACGIATSFFVLESTMHYLIESQIPTISQLDVTELCMIALILSMYATAVGVQILAPALVDSPSFHSWFVHVRNGFYVNVLFDRMVGTFKIRDIKKQM